MFHHLMLAIGLALLVLLLALLGPELDRLLVGQLPAFLPLRGRLRLEQWRLTTGHHLPEGHLEALAPAVVAERGLKCSTWRPSLIQPSCGESGGRPGRSTTFMGRCSGHLRRPALLAGHVISPALAAAGEVLAVGNQALV